MHVRDYMTTELTTASPETSLLDIQQLLLGQKYRHLPIVEESWLVGLLTQTDLLGALSKAKGQHKERIMLLDYLNNTPVQDVMTRDVVTASPMDTIEHAALVMRDRKIGCLPVTEDDNQLVGLLTETDVFDAMVDALGLRHGGARMTFPIPHGSERQEMGKVLKMMSDENLLPVAMAIYTPRNGPQQLVLRVRGASDDG